MSVVTQRQSIPWGSSLSTLELLLDRIGAGCVEVLEAERKLRVFGCIELTVEQKIIVMEWQATHVNDVYADAVLACIMQSELGGTNLKGATKQTKSEDSRFRECLIETLQDTFGDNCVPKMFEGDLLPVTVSGKRAEINLETLVSVRRRCFLKSKNIVNLQSFQAISCAEDDVLRQMLNTTVQKLHQTLVSAL